MIFTSFERQEQWKWLNNRPKISIAILHVLIIFKVRNSALAQKIKGYASIPKAENQSYYFKIRV